MIIRNVSENGTNVSRETIIKWLQRRTFSRSYRIMTRKLLKTHKFSTVFPGLVMLIISLFQRFSTVFTPPVITTNNNI